MITVKKRLSIGRDLSLLAMTEFIISIKKMKRAFIIKNKKGKKIHGTIEYCGKKYGQPILICHGYKGIMGQFQVKETAKALAKKGFTTVRFDATNSLGRSQGPLLDFTIASYISDIEAVINFILRKTKFYKVIFLGFSIAAMAGYIMAAGNKKIRSLILWGPPYDLSKGLIKKIQEQINKRGWATIYSGSLKRNVKMGDAVLKQGLKYNVKKHLTEVKCPTLVLMGDKEEKLNQKLIKKVYTNLRTKNKKFAIIKGAYHTIRTKKELKPFFNELFKWFKDNKLKI